MSRASKHVKSKDGFQSVFNSKIREKSEKGDFGESAPFYHSFDPTQKYFGGVRLNVESWYVKPVVLCAPHLNFPGVAIRCHHLMCSGHYIKKERAADRVIQGLHSEVYLLQYKYRCSNGVGCLNVDHSSYSSAEVVHTRRCPEYIRAATSSLFYLTHNSGVTGELLTYILTDAMSPKSFEDIQLGIKTFRETQYLESRAEYTAARDHICQTENLLPESFPDFSAMDDANGYDCQPNIPTTEYIIKVFQEYVSEHRESMESSFNDTAPTRTVLAWRVEEETLSPSL
jgi:hypothetical protein